jgi:hypothetical protein
LKILSKNTTSREKFWIVWVEAHAAKFHLLNKITCVVDATSCFSITSTASPFLNRTGSESKDIQIWLMKLVMLWK